MKSIRSLFMIAIGMMVFTVTASTTAKLEQKQKVEQVNGFDIHKDYSQVVNVFKEIQISQEIFAVEGKVLNLKKTVNELNSFTVSKDVGWRSSMIKYTTIKNKNVAADYSLKTIKYKPSQGESNPCRNDC
jgi:hypothetical protein